MLLVDPKLQPLIAGDCLSREEFILRWNQPPDLKFAELIDGVVYKPSPLSAEHGEQTGLVSTWLGHYAAFTEGCTIGLNATWFMLDDAPQPDVHLRIAGEGEASWIEEGFFHGAPEFVAETCKTSTSHDLHQKKDLYAAAGVKEYLAVLVKEREVRWHRLVGDSYQLLPCPPDGVIRSVVFPGLWLSLEALLNGDLRGLLQTLDRGLATPEHAEFVERLARKS